MATTTRHSGSKLPSTTVRFADTAQKQRIEALAGEAKLPLGAYLLSLTGETPPIRGGYRPRRADSAPQVVASVNPEKQVASLDRDYSIEYDNLPDYDQD